MTTEQYKNLTIRTGTYDRAIVNEVTRSYGWLDCEGRKVLDVGCNIGAFARMAVDKGASKVMGFEPELENYDLAALNCPEADIYQGALISGDEQSISFYLSTSGKNPGNYSTTEFRGRKKITVLTRKFQTVLDQFQPDVIKMDCEGSEYDLLLNTPLPDCVKEIAVEIHLNKPEWRAKKAKQLIKIFKGWKKVVKPTVGDKNWHTMAGFRRD